MKWLIGLVVILVIGFSIFSWFSGTYNSLVTKSATVDNAWAQVDTQYQRRFDLVPNLVAATKGAMAQEQKVFGDIAEARTHYAGTAAGTDARVQATSQYESALSRLMVIMENYPQLKSIDTVNRLMDELSGTENRVLIARDRYNASVKDYDVSIKQFPTNILAGMYGFMARSYFTPDEGASKAPTVNLTN